MGLTLPQPPARSAGESIRQDLWRGMTCMWAPCVTGRFSQGTSYTSRYAAIPDLGTNREGMRKSGGNPAMSPYGPSIVFAGGSNGGFFVSAGSVSSLNFIHQTAIYSISALIRSDAVGTFSTIADTANGTGGSKGFTMYQTSGGLVTFAAYNGVPGTIVNGAASTSLIAGNWYHILVTCDGTNQRIWINGRRNGSDAAVGTLGTGNATASMALGTYSGAGANTNSWNGQIAYFGIWNRVLSGKVAKSFGEDPLLMFRRKQRIIGKSITVSDVFIPQSIVIC